MENITAENRLAACWHISVRLSRLVAALVLAVLLQAGALLATMLWPYTTPGGAQGLNTAAQTLGGWPAWLAGFAGLGGTAALLAGAYAVWQRLACRWVMRYVLHGVEQQLR